MLVFIWTYTLNPDAAVVRLRVPTPASAAPWSSRKTCQRTSELIKFKSAHEDLTRYPNAWC